jgi:hypothetical protein
MKITIDRAVVEQALHVATGAGYPVALIAALKAALAEPVQELPWLRAIDEAMIDHHVGVADPADDYETAKRKLNNLLCHAQDIGAHFAKQAEPVQEPVAYGYASRLAIHIWQKHYKEVSPQWKPLDDLMGVLTQIANMTSGLNRQHAEPVQGPGVKPAHGWAAPKDRYAVPVLFNPYTGEPRDVRDVQSDPTGILIVPPGNVFPAAAKEQP